MEKASFLTRLRFSYTVALLDIFACKLRDRYRWQRKPSLHKVSAA